MSVAAGWRPVPVGEIFTRTVTLTTEGIHEFALAAGDMNPLHHDQMFAEASRFGGIIASGTHYVALIMGLVATHFTEQGREGAGMEFAFQLKKPVRAGDTITLRWQVAEVTPKQSLKGDILSLIGGITTQEGIEVMTCTGKVALFYPS
ncbi:MAG TPA: MaoC family dehydratase [Burkholderiales bacterium]|jgi:acyl dehydratase